MGYLEDLVSRASDLFASPIFTEAAPVEEFAIPHDSFDANDWAMLKEEVPGLNTNIVKMHGQHDYVPNFYEDLFNLLHQGDPKVNDPESMNERYRPNQSLADQFKTLPEMDGLRLSTMHDEYATAMAMLSMQPKLEDAYSRMAQAQEAAAAAADARQKAQDAMQAAQDALAAAQDGTGTAEAAGEAVQAAEDAAAAHQAAAEDASLQAADGAAQTKQAMRSATNQAAEERGDEESMMAAFGVQDGELKRMDFEERRRLAESLRTNRLAQFAKLIGSFRALADAERRRKVQHRPDMVVGVEFGNDLMRITAGEMTNLATPELEMDFWRRWASHELLQFKLEGTEKLGQGPIIVVCDESGSMQGSRYGGTDLKGGTPEAWSKALSLALCDQARRSRRDFHYIGFSSASQQWHTEFIGGVAPIAKVIEFTEHFYAGGTHYEKPLQMARDIVESYGAKDLPRPDVVFITDEEYGELDPAFVASWLKAKAATSMRCFGIAIGTRGGNGALKAVADDVRVITALTSDPSAMSDLFRTI